MNYVIHAKIKEGTSPMIAIRQATTETDFEHVGRLYLASRDWVIQTYPEFLQRTNMSPVELETEIASLPHTYSPPTGCLLLATYNGTYAGMVALADSGGSQCIMQHMFVNSEFRGAKIGRALAEAIIAEARRIGYAQMRLNTGPRHVAALHLYRSLGFTVVSQGNFRAGVIPQNLPDDLKNPLISMELDL